MSDDIFVLSGDCERDFAVCGSPVHCICSVYRVREQLPQRSKLSRDGRCSPSIRAVSDCKMQSNLFLNDRIRIQHTSSACLKRYTHPLKETTAQGRCN